MLPEILLLSQFDKSRQNHLKRERRIMKQQNKLLPSDLLSQINRRIELLQYVIDKANKQLISCPEGKIHVSPGTSIGTYRYFVRTDSKDKTGEYLHKNEEKKIRGLCQRKYYEDLIKKCSNEIKILEKTIQKLEGDSIVSSYEMLSKGIQCKIDPMLFDDISYTNMWLSQEYKGLPFDEDDKTEYYTDKGERVRSKSEILIANYLYRLKIPYLYEKPIMLNSGRIVYPDFTILDISERREKYLEHLGKLGDVDYVMRNIRKMNEYRENEIYLGLNLFFTVESGSAPVSVRDIEKIVLGMGVIKR